MNIIGAKTSKAKHKYVRCTHKLFFHIETQYVTSNYKLQTKPILNSKNFDLNRLCVWFWADFSGDSLLI